MGQNLKELKKMISFLRKNGVSQYKSGDFEIALSPTHKSYSKPKDSNQTEPKIEKEFTQEEMLYWSSPGFPEEANQ